MGLAGRARAALKLMGIETRRVRVENCIVVGSLVWLPSGLFWVLVGYMRVDIGEMVGDLCWLL